MTHGIDTKNLFPSHVAFIMDGNRRWAKKKKLKIIDGHKKGSEIVKKIVKKSLEFNIKYLTLFSFSKENWKRDPSEISNLMDLMESFESEYLDEIILNNIRVTVIGDIDTQRIINADKEPHNWLAHGRDYYEQRYSPLDQINTKTIKDLELEWSLDMGTTRGLEATPIVDNGIMFVSSTWSVVHAVDAKTGEELWVYDPNVPRSWAR